MSQNSNNANGNRRQNHNPHINEHSNNNHSTVNDAAVVGGRDFAAESDPASSAAAMAVPRPVGGTTGGDITMKMLVVGESTVGKTSFIHRYIKGEPPTGEYKSTIGVDFSRKIFRLDNGFRLVLQIWDIAGQSRFAEVARVYFRKAHCALIMYDVTSAKTFNATHDWRKNIMETVLLPDQRPIPCLLVGNKCDKPRFRVFSEDFIRNICTDLCYIGCFEASAKTGENVDNAMAALIDYSVKYSLNMNSGTQNAEQNATALDLSKDKSKDAQNGGASRNCCV